MLGASRRSSLFVLAFVALVGAWAFSHLVVRTRLDDFMPPGEDPALAALATSVLESHLTRTIVLTVGPAPDDETAARWGRSLSTALADEAVFASVQGGPTSGTDEALYTLAFPRRYELASSSLNDASAATTDAALREAARRLRAELVGPTALVVRRLAPEDPLLLFQARMDSLASSSAGLAVVGGQFVARDSEGAWGTVFLRTHGSTFDSTAQRRALQAIARAFERLPPEARLEQAGVGRFAVSAERSLQADLARISIVSTLGIVVLFGVLFRSLRILALGFIPLAVGTIASIAACQLIFGGVHAITLAFGSSLLGVGIDYVAHFASHHVLAPRGRSPMDSMREIRPGLVLGAITSILGLFGLGFTSFPGMRELGVFASVGVLASLVTTIVVLPPFFPRAEATPSLERLARSLAGAHERLVRTRAPALGLALLVLVVGVGGVARLTLVDDLRRLNATDPAMQDEDRRVRTRVGQGDAGRFVVALGTTDEDSLVANEQIAEALQAARAEGSVESVRSCAGLLPSRATQEASARVFRGDASLPDRLNDALAAEGFVPELFAPFRASLAEHPGPLTPELVLASPLAPLLAPFRVELPDGAVAYLTYVGGLRNSTDLETRLAAIEGAHFFDQARYLEGAYRVFRERALFLVLVGLGLVVLACSLKYRDARRVLAAVSPAVLASLGALGVVGLVAGEANLMHLIACMLVLSMGEDYAVFLIEARDTSEGPASAFVGIVLACVTTVLSFGVLALSAHPALRALGVVTSIGVFLSALLAPLALVLVPERRPS